MKLDRDTLLDEVRRLAVEKYQRMSVIEKNILGGDRRCLGPASSADSSFRYHNRPGWDRMLMWLRQLGYDVEFRLVERAPAMPAPSPSGTVRALAHLNALPPARDAGGVA